MSAHNRDPIEASTLEHQLREWGAAHALSLDRAEALHRRILATASAEDAIAHASVVQTAPWPDAWWEHEMAALRAVIQRCVSLDGTLAPCSPERLRAAVGPL
jgi:hypothetical protein